MLTNQEMYEKVQSLWFSMTEKNQPMDLHIYFEQPKYGYGYKGDGEFFIYVKSNEYFFSFSERGAENIMAQSVDFQDIEFEIAKL